MARDFKICDKDYVNWLFKDKLTIEPEEYISYRHFILHALHHLIHEKKASKEEITQHFDKLCNAFNSKIYTLIKILLDFICLILQVRLHEISLIGLDMF